MDDQEVSAFAAYANKKSKKKSELEGFKVKPKNKLKKNSPKDVNLNSIVVKLLQEAVESNTPRGVKKKKKKSAAGTDLKSNQKKERSLFENISFTSKTDNVFFNENGLSDDVEMNDKLITKMEHKKLKKRKIKEEPSSVKKSKILKPSSTSILSGKTEEPVIINSFNEVGTDLILHKKKSKELEGSSKIPNLIYSDSSKIGEEVLSWLLSPVELNDFFTNCWEQKPLHINHNNKDYFKSICTMEDFSIALREHDMYFTKNIDVTSYINGVRSTENLEGKAKPATVWNFYRNGKSIRLLNPQTFIPKIRMMNSFLQEFFQCFVGANIYLTPPGTQGFAPHYDDIEAFVLQLEGEKHWKLYNPRSADEVLPRESSGNFTEAEIGDPILEVTLHAGDLLYFPRGIIHQARCLPHVHSLHVTVSCYQKNSWGDLLEKALPVALQRAISENVEFRKGLPIGYLNHLGMVYYDQKSDQRVNLIQKFEKLAQKVLEYCPLDPAVDQLGVDFMHDALPPFLAQIENEHGGNRDIRNINECLLDALKKYSDRSLGVKLIRAHCVRLVSEQEVLMLYYTTDNSLIYREQDPACVSIPGRWAQAIDQLILSYPKFVEMKNLTVSFKVDKPSKWKHVAELVYFLWQKGLLLFDKPLKQLFS